MANHVKIGFVGVGMMGQSAHLRNYVNVPGCDVVAISEVRPKLAASVAQRYGVKRVYPDHAQMLAKEKLDAIVAAQPFVWHGRIVTELLDARVPIFIEKPLAGSVEQGERIVRAAAEAKTWVMVGYHKRSDPAVACAKAEIERLKQTGELGKLRYARLTMPPGDWTAGGLTGRVETDEPVPFCNQDPPPPDMSAETYEKFVQFTNGYIHQINLLRYLIGTDYRVSYADPNRLLLVATTDDGVTATIEIHPYQTTRSWQESALVTFERGYVRIDIPAPLSINRPGRVEFFRDPGKDVSPQTIVPQLPWVGAMAKQAENFVAAVRGDAPPPCDAREALADLKVAREYFRLLKP